MIKTVLTWILYVVLGSAALFMGGGFVMLILSVGAVALGVTAVIGLGALLFYGVRAYFYPPKSRYLDE